MTSVDSVIPARNEAGTIAEVVRAVASVPFVREVIVVDDGSSDGTGDIARLAGAKVIRREPGGSKAHAMRAGVSATDAESILFVDGDVIGLRPEHIVDFCRPYLEGRAALALGTFDYGFWNPLVLRMPPTSGERILPRWVFESVTDDKLDGYTIEVMINEVICECRLPWSASVMRGVTHRTKRDKFGRAEGYRRTWRMFWQLVGLLRVVRLRTYWFYLRDLTVEPVAG